MTPLTSAEPVRPSQRHPLAIRLDKFTLASLGLIAIILLGVLAVQATMGLFVDPEDYLNVGPLAGLVGIDNARTALGWHHTLAPVILLLVGLHVAAIVFYKRWKHEDLIRPMVTGEKTVRRA